jgi:hypothetical protein
MKHSKLVAKLKEAEEENALLLTQKEEIRLKLVRRTRAFDVALKEMEEDTMRITIASAEESEEADESVRHFQEALHAALDAKSASAAKYEAEIHELRKQIRNAPPTSKSHTWGYELMGDGSSFITNEDGNLAHFSDDCGRAKTIIQAHNACAEELTEAGNLRDNAYIEAAKVLEKLEILKSEKRNRPVCPLVFIGTVVDCGQLQTSLDAAQEKISRLNGRMVDIKLKAQTSEWAYSTENNQFHNNDMREIANLAAKEDDEK